MVEVERHNPAETDRQLGESTHPADNFDFAYRIATPLWVFDIDNRRTLFANASACKLWRAECEAELCGRDFSVDMSSTVHKRLRQYQTDFADGQTFKEMWTLYPNGEPVSVEVLFSGFRLQDGGYAMLCEATNLKEEVPENLRSLEALLHTDVMISLYQQDGHPLYMNPAARNALAKKDANLAAQFVDPADYETLAFELDRFGEHTLVSKVHTANGRRWHKLTVKTCLDAATGDAALLVTANDVTELKNARDRARYLADRDQLTGCFNRAFLQQAFQDAARYNPQPAALLFFDVDRFKQINDRFGHEFGDHVLKTLTSRAEATIKKSDILARIGGDEFVILFEPGASEEEFEAIAHRIHVAMRKPIRLKSITLTPTVSMGLTLFRPDAEKFTATLREADLALYASKAAGRDRLTVFDEALGAAAQERDRIEVDIKAAIERDEFVLFFQPRVDFGSGKILSAEALVRWQHPTRGLVMPDQFIPFCEESGLIIKVGRVILNAGLRQAQAWQAEGLDIGISINISPAQFDDPQLMTALSEFAAIPGFPAQNVELELTENLLIGDKERLARKLRAISELGYRIAIDDFGVGYSNLSYISNFPVDCIKIDRSFISQLPIAGPVIKLILTLARQIGACTVAEGVETEEQAKWLRDEQCHQAQGYLFCRPKPPEELKILLASDAHAPG